MNKLVLGNVLHRPLRTLISMVAVAIEVVMILSIVAIMVGMVSNATHEQSGIGADIIVRPPNASFISSVGGGGVETIWGIDFESYNALRPFVFLEGGPFKAPNDVIVDDLYARSGPKGPGNDRSVGATIKLLNHEYRICGIVEHGKGGRVFMPIHTLGTLMGSPDNASLFYIRSDNLKNQSLIRDEIHAIPALKDYQVQTIQEWMSLMTPEHLPGFNVALDTVITIAVIVGFLVIFQSLYTAVMERTREIGVLKSLGASKLYILNVVLREALLVSIAGIILGIVLTQIIKFGIGLHFPTFSFQLTNAWRIKATLIALAGSLLGAIYPAWKAARKDPIDALAYE
jgi:putative ABC transport system permease protein